MTRPPLRNELPEFLQDLRGEIDGLLECWYDRFTFARPRFLERYLNKEAVCHVHGLFGSLDFCARLIREELGPLGSSPLEGIAAINDGELHRGEVDNVQQLVLIESVQFMDEPQRVISRSGFTHTVWLQQLDRCTSAHGEALYLSLPRLTYVFGEFPPYWETRTIRDRTPVDRYEATNKHVEGGPEIVGDISDDRTKAQGEIGERIDIFPGLAIVLDDEHIQAFLPRPDMGIKVTEMLFGPLNLRLRRLPRRDHGV